ncbi:MAG: hydroxylamine reductase [Elusimicrobiota bacterium]
MFCYQCEQTCQGSGCTKVGVCGKQPEAAALMDKLLDITKEIAWYAHRGTVERETDHFVLQALFTTVTNVDFDTQRLQGWVDKGQALLRSRGGAREKTPLSARIEKSGRDVAGLQELILYGLKGMAAYAEHARELGKEDDDVYAFFHEALSFLGEEPQDVNALVAMAMRVGEMNLKVMELLDAGNTGAYGHPEPTKARVTPIKGKCILVSGHDLRDLEALLKQTEGKGVNVYTHGEMLPCLAYPGLKKYKHLVGNYGGAWQEQVKEFAQFPGAILMTTNCIQRPAESYKGRIFTCGLVAWPGVRHIPNRDFSPVIEAALAAPGFAEDDPAEYITVGFGRQAVLGVADKVIAAVKAGQIKRFFLIGGCDGAKPGRSYYTELARSVPKDCVILTLACGKYRFNKLEFGDIGGIPRLLDIGQCNDAYSAIVIAGALAKAFNCGVNDLPLSLVLSWYEQKAVAILLTLLHLGIKGIRIGPSLPAFVGPAVLKVLSEKFDLKPVTTPKQDLEAILGPAVSKA